MKDMWQGGADNGPAGMCRAPCIFQNTRDPVRAAGLIIGGGVYGSAVVVRNCRAAQPLSDSFGDRS